MEYTYNHNNPPQKSAEIAQYQKRLNYIRNVFHGQWRYLSPDGVYGRGTRDAVRLFQTYANISVNGRLDHPTQAHIVLHYERARWGYTPAPKAAMPNYQPANVSYTVAPSGGFDSMSCPPPQSHRLAVNTSSIIDSEWKSLGKDMMRIIEEVAGYLRPEHLKDEAAIKRFLAEELQRNGAELKRLIRKKNTIAANFRRDMSEVAQYAAVDRFNATVFGSNTNNAGIKRQLALDRRWKAQGELKKQANKLSKRIQQETKAVSSAAKLGKVAKRAKYASWGVNLGTAAYYINGMVQAQSDEEYNQYAGKLTNTIGTTIIDAGLTIGSGAAVRMAAASAGGPAGIVVVLVITLLDVVLLATTGESLSTKIWNFFKGVDWDRVQVYSDYAFMGMNGRRSYGPKY